MNHLYYDPDAPETITTRVLDKRILDGAPYYRFEQELFYPGGGGQPADRGTVNGILVIDAVKAEEGMYYRLEEELEREEAFCALDTAFRRDYTVQHTAQHILSAFFDERYGAKTDSFHMGEENCSIELSIPHISWEILRAVEEMAFDAITKGLPVRTETVSRERADALPLRKAVSAQENIRIVTIPGVDVCACSGTHVKNTAQIGLVKIIKAESKRDCTKIFFVAGHRALRDYALKNDVIQEVNAVCSTTTEEILPKLKKDGERTLSLKKKCASLAEDLAIYKADALRKVGKTFVIYEDELNCLNLISAYLSQYAQLAFAGVDRSEKKIIVSQACGKPLKPILKELSQLPGVKGGGSDQKGQLSYDTQETRALLLNRLEEMLS